MTNDNQAITPMYSSDTVMTFIERRWVFGVDQFPPVRKAIIQIDHRPLFEMVRDSSSVTGSLSNRHTQRMIKFSRREAAMLFSSDVEHHFLLDQEYDYYPTSRVSHNYVRIENDPVNILYTDGHTGTKAEVTEKAYVEAANQIGALRDGYHRKIEHMGGTPRMELLRDLAQAGVSPTLMVTDIQHFPPKSTDPATPDRTFLRTSDMGYVHYIKSSYDASVNEALEVKNVSGSKEFIWDKADMIRGITLPTDIIGNAAVELKDIETLQNAALEAVHTNLDNTWPADDQVWERFHIPGRTKIKMSTSAVEITQYQSDYSTVNAQFIMTLGGSIVIKNLQGGTVTMTINAGKVDVS